MILESETISKLPEPSPVRSSDLLGVGLLEVFSTGGGTQSTAIAALIIQGKLPKILAKKFGVSATLIRLIRRGKRWSHLEYQTA